MTKKIHGKTFFVLSAFGFLTLASCGLTFRNASTSPSASPSSDATTSTPSPTSSTPTSSNQSTPTSTSLPSSTSTSVDSGMSLTLSLKNNSITEGLSFLSGCQPTITYHNGTSLETLALTDTDLTYTLTKGTTSYGVSSLLPVGSYGVKVKSASKKVSTDIVSFSVVASNPVSATEGHGYVSKDVSSSSVSNYTNLSALGQSPLGSKGTKKILVVPVYFTGGTSFTSSELTAISDAYNGAASSTGWQSLSSFYQTSSYGSLDIVATIASAYRCTQTESQFQSAAVSSGYEQTVAKLGNTILTSLASSLTLSNYDADQDGYLDGFEMVYKGTKTWDGQDGSATEVWWNYTSFSSQGKGTSASPKTGIFFWSQYSLLTDNFYSPNIDCHTLIHETGHMLGLDDYYSYDDDGSPTAMCDMMDFNIGDHNAYSKMLLGWIKPKYIDGSESDFTLSLSSFTEKGDCIVLRNTSTDPWNQTPFDEYLLLQYYTPTGLNELDATGYPEWANYGVGGLYKKAGLQVFHVDSRVATTYGEYTDSLSTSGIFLPENNTPSYAVDIEASLKNGKTTYNSPYKKLKALPATGKDVYMNENNYKSYLGAQTTLFGTASYGCGSTFYDSYAMSALFANGTSFDDGSTLNYNFNVQEQTDSSITLHFVKTA
jgi:M6 family metalloprotease-like protein